MMIDTYRHKGLRRQMVEELCKKGITDKRVLDAMRNVPRHFFIDSSLDTIAYQDRSLEILCNQTISQPSTVAFQSSLLEIEPRDKVLEIGTGSGYQTAVLLYLRARVYTIERQRNLYLKTDNLFKEINLHPINIYGDGYQGFQKYAPYNKILITCACPQIPQALILQLKVGGYIVVPIGEGDKQEMTRYTLKEDGTLEKETFGEFHFVPMLKEKNK